ncbi:MAG: ABC transporter permease [Pirellulaceae bacterium]|nr:ABC transporter permease [Pirellulaceae bacterium]
MPSAAAPPETKSFATDPTPPLGKDQPLSPQPLRASASLAWREILRFFRQPNRIVGSIGTPVLFWLLFGMGLKKSFSLSAAGESGISFLEYYFSGSLVLILLFTSIFTSISIIEDRREGFLQGVLVAPIPRWSVVLGKVMGGTFVALFQGLIFLLLALTLDIEWRPLAIVQLVGLLALTSLALTSLGFFIAWRMDSTQGFHAIMNLVLMPLWLLSGGFFPIPAVMDGTTWTDSALHWTMRLNPLSYAVAGTRQLLEGTKPMSAAFTPDLAWCWGVTLLFAVSAFAAATWVAGQRTQGDLL